MIQVSGIAVIIFSLPIHVGVLDNHNYDPVAKFIYQTHKSINECASFDVAADQICCNRQRSDKQSRACDAQESRHHVDAPTFERFRLAERHPNASDQTDRTTQ